MEIFSAASISATYSTLSHRALSTVVELDEIIDRGAISVPLAEKIKLLIAGLTEFKQTVEHLREKLDGSSAISDELQQALSEPLSACDGAVAVMSKQVKKIAPETPMETINLDMVTLYADLLKGYAQLFNLEAELLSNPSHDQQRKKLQSSEARGLTGAVESMSRAVIQRPEILLPAADAGYVSAEQEKAMLAASFAEQELPPSFEEVVTGSRSSQSSQAGGRSGESSSGGGGGGGFMSSISSGFKAMTAAMRPKPEPFVSALCQAATRGDIPQMKGLLRAGANINGRNEDGNTALICGTIADQVEAARFLLSSGADHTVKDSGRKGKPPFFHAIEVSSTGLIELFLARGVDVNEKNIYGQPFFVDILNTAGLDAVRLLLSRGANPNATDLYGTSVLALATKKGNLPLIKLLAENGANVNATENSQPSIVVAFNNGREDIANYLLSRGADPNSRTVSGVPLVVEAVNKNNPGFAKALLERAANPNSQDHAGVKLLALVAKSTVMNDPEKEKLTKLLLSHGANPNETNGWGQPPLFANVMAGGNARLIKMFLEHGANPNTNLPSGETYLLNAMDKNDRDLVELLLKYGANPNESDKQNRTALFQAMLKGEKDLVQKLVQHGADVNKLGSISPLEFVRATGDAQTEQLLRLHGAHGSVDNVAAPAHRRAAPTERPASPPPGYNE